jgi:hypothetical protein
MSFVFLSLTLLMLAAATAFVVMPFKIGKPILASPAALLVVFVPLGAIALYALLGSPNAMTAETSPRKSTVHTLSKPAGSEAKRSYGSVASLTDGLRDRLEAEPNDAGGWLLLAKSYQHLGRDAEALDAYVRAQALGKSDAGLEVSLLGASLATPASVVDTGPVLRGHVSLSPEAASLVRPDDTVFVFAKESPEHRMPVVALRKRVSDLPLDFVLTDKEMMVSDSSLGDFTELVITAKVSRSGNASDNSQGLETWSSPVSPLDNRPVQLVIAAKSQDKDNNDE